MRRTPDSRDGFPPRALSWAGIRFARRQALHRYRSIATLSFIAAALAAGFGGGYWWGQLHREREAFPVLWRAPSYALTNQLGRRVDSRSFLGRVQVVTFLFPYCTEYCPLIAAHLVSLEDALAAAGLAAKVQFVAFNVDPAHAGPDAMATFMRQYGWNPRDTRWQYLTGSPATVRLVVTGGFHVDYEQIPESLVARQEREAERAGAYAPSPTVENPLAERVKPDYDVTHNDALVLVDRQGRVRRLYQEADRITDAALVAAIRRLLAER